MAEINDFEASTAEEVIQQLRDLKREVKNLRRQFHPVGKPQQPSATYVAKVTEAAAALTAGVAGKGTAEIQSIKHTGEFARKSSPTEFFNFSNQAAAVGSYITLIAEPHSGRLVMTQTPGQDEGNVPFDFFVSAVPAGAGSFYGSWKAVTFASSINGTSVSVTSRRDVTLQSLKLKIRTEGWRHFVVRFDAEQDSSSPFTSTDPMPFQLQPVVNGTAVTSVTRDFWLPPRTGSASLPVGIKPEFCFSFTLYLEVDDLVHLQARSFGTLDVEGQASIGPGVLF